MNFNEATFPRTVAYLKQLPAGLASYPDCRVKAEVHESVRRDHAQLARPGEIPDELIRYFTGEYSDEWIPEVWAGALSLMVRDQALGSDEELFAWRYDAMTALFHTPLNRVKMMLFSPTLIIMGATGRWGSFHTGSTLMVEPVVTCNGRNCTTATLTGPAHLFNDLFARLIGTTYQAALECSRAKNSTFTVSAVTPTTVSYEAAWDA